MMSRRKILIITERRADYSRFKPILKLIKKSKFLDYILVVTGTHLLKTHGLTVDEIKKDQFRIDYKIKSFFSLNTDDGENMVVAIGNVLNSRQLNPLLHLLGCEQQVYLNAHQQQLSQNLLLYQSLLK